MEVIDTFFFLSPLSPSPPLSGDLGEKTWKEKSSRHCLTGWEESGWMAAVRAPLGWTDLELLVIDVKVAEQICK